MPSNKIEMKLEDAERYARHFLDCVEPTTGMASFEIAGSIRRRRPIVHDVDVVFKPIASQREFLFEEVHELCQRMPNVEIIKWGTRLAAILHRGNPFDLYFAGTDEVFATLLLIRTGSVENNIRLATFAKRRGWKLHASGEGLFNEKGERIAGDSERSIYDALGVKWQEPWERL